RGVKEQMPTGHAKEMRVAGGVDFAQLADGGGFADAADGFDWTEVITHYAVERLRAVQRAHVICDSVRDRSRASCCRGFVTSDGRAEMNPRGHTIGLWRRLVNEHFHAAVADLMSASSDEDEICVGLSKPFAGEACKGQENRDARSALAGRGEPTGDGSGHDDGALAVAA